MTAQQLAPTGPMLSVLRRMLTKPLTTTTDGGRLWGTVGGEHVSAVTLGGLVKRGLVKVAGEGNTFVLTAEGSLWATGKKR